jgi:ElaB/YqjD/DUF883 family membrane-anchored ribosome-binding protein
MPATTQPEIDDVSTSTTPDLKSLIREAEEALSDTVADTGDRFAELRERLRAAAVNNGYSFQNLRNQAAQRAKQADQLVRDNPYYTAGIAAGVGALIGIIVSRSCSSR